MSNVSVCCVYKLVSFCPYDQLEVTNRQTPAFAGRALDVLMYLFP